MFWPVLFALVMLGAPAAAQAPAPQTSAPQSAPSLFERLSPAERELLRAAADLTPETQFLPGQLLSSLPYPAPALPGQNVIGSVGDRNQSRVIVQTSLPQTQAQQVAEQPLRAAGWREMYPGAGPATVFESGIPGNGYASPLCKVGVPGSLNVVALPTPTGTAQVSYSYASYGANTCPANTTPENPAEVNFYSPMRGQLAYQPSNPLQKLGLKLPSLPTPAGAEVREPSSISSETEFSAYASVYGPQTTDALRQHYLDSLTSQGWTLVDTRTLAGQSISRLTRTVGDKELVSTLSFKARTDLKGPERLTRRDVAWRLQTY